MTSDKSNSFAACIFVKIYGMKSISFVLILLLLAACTDSSNKIVGRWKLEEIDYSSYFREVSDEVRDFLQEQMNTEFARLKDKTFFEFGADNSLILEAPNYEKKQAFTNGKWSMNNAKDSLFLDLADPEAYKIITLNDSELFLTTDDTPKRTLRLTKVK